MAEFKFLANLEQERLQSRISTYSKNNPKLKVLLAGVGAISFGLSFYKRAEIESAQQEIQRRKEQLKKPVYELSNEEQVQFPWSQRNLSEWKHRLVKITGRQIHSRVQLIPRTSYGQKGYDYIVPLVTSENANFGEQCGVLINKGFIPEKYHCASLREKIENSGPETFIGYVSINDELNRGFFTSGNNTGDYDQLTSHANNRDFNSVDLQDMAEATGFKNQKQVKTAIIELVQQDSPLNERNSQHHSHDCEYKGEYPYKKTNSGALQLKKMPWDLSNESANYFNPGLVASGLSLAFAFV